MPELSAAGEFPLEFEDALILDRRFGKLQPTSKPKKIAEIFHPDPMAKAQEQTHLLAYSRRLSCDQPGLLLRRTTTIGENSSSTMCEAYRLDSNGDLTWKYARFESEEELAWHVTKFARRKNVGVDDIYEQRLLVSKGFNGAEVGGTRMSSLRGN